MSGVTTIRRMNDIVASLRTLRVISARWTLLCTPQHRAIAAHKYVFVHVVVVSELKFHHGEWQMLLADLLKRTYDATLEDRPKALDGAARS